MKPTHVFLHTPLALSLLLLGAARAGAADDVLLEDFEGETYGDWKTTGEAFGTGPARGTLANQMPVEGFLGKGLVNSYFRGDGTTGSLTSPEFKLERKYLRFLIGGGKHDGKTCINLIVGGNVVRTASGPNDQPGGSERLEWRQWNVEELKGEPAVIQIVDEVSGGWGHINVDHILLTDQRLPGVIENARRVIEATKEFLNLPVKNGAPKRRMQVIAGEQVQREFEIELADREPDWWAPLDLRPFAGQKLVLQVNRLPEDSQGLASIDQTDEPKESGSQYAERLRPQFHFSPRRGWLNDPNGLVYHRGQWHLFFQHNPYGWAWGNMHWGHAVSQDLFRWTELPIALYPQKFGDWAFSGSAVVDEQNTSGFGTKDNPPLVAAYTSTGRGECIVYSSDGGTTWTEFDGNPVVKHVGRDPRLLWHGPTSRWVMAVYDEHEGGKLIAFYSSPDLKAWTFESRIAGFYECPDLFELPVDGDATDTLWVLSAADSNYMLGAFDGRRFTPQTGMLTGNYGNCFYAAQTYSNAPDNRRIIIGWLRSETRDMPFNQCMSLPCELSLRRAQDGARLAYEPVREIAGLRDGGATVFELTDTADWQAPADKTGELIDVSATIEPGAARDVTFTVRGIPAQYNVSKQELTCQGKTAPVPLADGKLHLRALVDRTTLEIFAADGVVYMPLAVQAKGEDRSVKLAADGKLPKARIEIARLRSAWLSPGRAP